MKIFLDFLPILLFFVAYKTYDIYVATGVLMAATVAQMAYIYYTERALQTMHKVTLVLILGFGALTLLLHDERFIKWKPTVLYAVLARVRVATPYRGLGGLLRFYGGPERLCGSPVQHRDLGELQTLGLRFSAGVHRGPGLLYLAPFTGRRAQGVNHVSKHR
jgi:Intracellular septation protein A